METDVPNVKHGGQFIYAENETLAALAALAGLAALIVGAVVLARSVRRRRMGRGLLVHAVCGLGATLLFWLPITYYPAPPTFLTAVANFAEYCWQLAALWLVLGAAAIATGAMTRRPA